MTAHRRSPRLSDPRQAADHVRLVVNPRFYHHHTLMVVTTDERDRPRDHIEVVECSLDPSASECATVLSNLLAAGGDTPRGLVLALTRPGGEAIQAVDRVWFRAFHRVCHSRGVRALGVYVVGGHGARAVHIDDAA